jgi:hypothetical protein
MLKENPKNCTRIRDAGGMLFWDSSDGVSIIVHGISIKGAMWDYSEGKLVEAGKGDLEDRVTNSPLIRVSVVYPPISVINEKLWEGEEVWKEDAPPIVSVELPVFLITYTPTDYKHTTAYLRKMWYSMYSKRKKERGGEKKKEKNNWGWMSMKNNSGSVRHGAASSSSLPHGGSALSGPFSSSPSILTRESLLRFISRVPVKPSPIYSSCWKTSPEVMVIVLHEDFGRLEASGCFLFFDFNETIQSVASSLV